MGVDTLGVKICTTEQKSCDIITSIVGRMFTGQSGLQIMILLSVSSTVIQSADVGQLVW